MPLLISIAGGLIAFILLKPKQGETAPMAASVPSTFVPTTTAPILNAAPVAPATGAAASTPKPVATYAPIPAAPAPAPVAIAQLAPAMQAKLTTALSDTRAAEEMMKKSQAKRDNEREAMDAKLKADSAYARKQYSDSLSGYGTIKL